MDFHTFTTLREACKRSGIPDDPEDFYRMAFADAVTQGEGQFYGQLHNEREWERARRPYYAVWPSIVPMLTRLNLDLDSSLIPPLACRPGRRSASTGHSGRLPLPWCRVEQNTGAESSALRGACDHLAWSKSPNRGKASDGRLPLEAEWQSSRPTSRARRG